ncbi:MAG: hypothetical protein CSA38_05675 [Flavobacteriales bacterium]|nr:MAG: hypothetical protein CSA38_05675 [Flavobacteriales bacterium]
MKYTVKPINFKLGEYISLGFEDFKNDIGDYLIAFLLTMIMSIIPFCSLLAVGNFYKFCRDKRAGKNPETTQIFNFDDFVPYLIFQLILFGIIIILLTPIFLWALFSGIGAFLGQEAGEGGTAVFVGLSMITFLLLLLLIFVVLFYLAVKSFYMIGLISLEGIKDLGTAWKMSKKMTKTNFLNIFLFSIIVGIIAQLGLFLFGIGIFLTIPISYIIHYHAFEDGIQQIKEDEMVEIGQV